MSKRNTLMTSVATAPLVAASGTFEPLDINFNLLRKQVLKNPPPSSVRLFPPAAGLLQLKAGSIQPQLAGSPEGLPFWRFSPGQLAKYSELRWARYWGHVPHDEIVRRVLSGDPREADVWNQPSFIRGISLGPLPKHWRRPSPDELWAITDLDHRADVLAENPDLDLTEGPYHELAKEVVASITADEPPSFAKWSIADRLRQKPGRPPPPAGRKPRRKEEYRKPGPPSLFVKFGVDEPRDLPRPQSVSEPEPVPPGGTPTKKRRGKRNDRIEGGNLFVGWEDAASAALEASPASCKPPHEVAQGKPPKPPADNDPEPPVEGALVEPPDRPRPLPGGAEAVVEPEDA